MQPVQHGLHDDHRAVHDQAEVQCAEAHQVAAHAEQVHHDHGEEHGQRDHRGHHQPGAQVGQEEHQDQHHDQRAFQQVRLHRVDGVVHHLGAVQEGLDGHALGQGLLDRGDALLHMLDHLAGVRALQHHHHRTGRFAFIVVGHGTVAGRSAQAHFGHIVQQNRRMVRQHLHLDGADGLHVGDEALGADEEHRWSCFDVRPAGVGVVAGHGIEDIRDGDAHGAQSFGVHGDLILLQFAAEAAHVGHTFGADQLAPHDPVLDGAQFRRVVLAFVAGLGLHHVLEDLAEAAGNGPQFRLSQGLRNGDLRQTFGDLLACPVHIGGVVEHDGDEREPEAAEAALLDDPRHVARGLLDGEGDQALDVTRPQGRAHGDHLHLVVGDVGYGVDRQLGDVVGAKADKPEHQRALR